MCYLISPNCLDAWLRRAEGYRALTLPLSYCARYNALVVRKHYSVPRKLEGLVAWPLYLADGSTPSFTMKTVVVVDNLRRIGQTSALCFDTWSATWVLSTRYHGLGKTERGSRAPLKG